MLEPTQCVLDEEPANRAALGSIEIDGLPPRRYIAVGKVRPELAKIVSFRPKVVIYHIKSDREPVGVRGIYEPLKRKRASVTILDRKRKNAVVTPIARTGKLRNRHHLNRRHSQGGQLRQMRGQAVQRSFRGISTHVDFIENAFLDAGSLPIGIGPMECGQIHDFGWAVNALGLKPRRGIRILVRIVQPVEVTGLGLDVVRENLMVAPAILCHRQAPLARTNKMRCNLLPIRSPDHKFPRSTRLSVGAQRQLIISVDRGQLFLASRYHLIWAVELD